MTKRVFSLPALSKCIAAYLTANFGQYYTAKHNSNIVYPKLEQLTDLKVDIYPAAVSLKQQTKAGLSTFATLNIVFQQRAKDQEAVDILTDLCIETLEFVLLKRFLNDSVYSADGDFVGSNVFDKLVKYEENVFQSIIEVNFQRII